MNLAVPVLLVLAQPSGPLPPGEFLPELIARPDGHVVVPNPAFPSPPPVEAPRGAPAIHRAELTPYFAEGALAEAKAAYDAEDFARARALLDGVPDTAPVRYLRAMAALEAGDRAFAVDELDALAQAYPPLADRCRYTAARAAEALEDHSRALALYQAISGRSRLKPEATLGEARALLALRRPAEALSTVEPLTGRPAPAWGNDLGAEALWLAAMAAPSRTAAHASLVALWARHPLSREARRAEARLGDVSRLGAVAHVDRADALIEAHHNAPGLALLEPLLPALRPGDALGCRARFLAGKALRKLRRHPQAIAMLTPVTTRCEDPDLVARALYTLGVCRTYAAPLSSAATFEALVERFPGSSLADDALLFAAEGRIRRGEPELAFARLTRLVDDYPFSDMAPEALFRLHWMIRDRPAEARVFLEELQRRFATLDDTLELERARYWTGRSLEAEGDALGALAAYRALAVDHPASYHGLLARERVLALDPAAGAELSTAVAAAPSGEDPFPLELGPLAEDPHFRSAVELVRLGLPDGVVGDVMAVDRTGLRPPALMVLVHLLSLAGEERSAHGLARLWLARSLSGPISARSRPLFELAYPRAFTGPVHTWAAAAGNLDPALVFALMREESGLDPRALSWAGALGLCQLMPATAAEVAGWLGLPRPSPAAILDPDLNIRLGTRYLATLLRRAGGTTQYALAGYNAGEGAVRRWRARTGPVPLDEWVESIPVPETRGYVRRVLRSYNTYTLLYTGEDVARAPPPPPRPPGRSKG